ncbi:WxL domain-containing protein [Enterococcus sp. CWB-B31]|uniref:WxL domain-containing protein n=1 Tax=Enterococcus sp. CWB-B31 TaxID=2885159 RepID=UPI001E298FF4|nr:WxL domain-containing protein [Enterococcus sp. CWB-B31]MCB5956445.1 WxL domain-containing protein [Enterococcus sp. CWB-B31]
MKLITYFKCSLALLLFAGMTAAVGEQACASSLDGSGSVNVVGKDISPPVDPEKPGNEVNPGEGPSTTGDLRIDFVSSLNFAAAEITETNRTYESLAQLFHSDTAARGYYIQVSDFRSEPSGWSLTLSQDTPFTSSIIQTLEDQSLKGAVLSFGNGWANSAGNSQTPTVSRDTLAINEMNTAYTVAVAGSGQGKGVWTIAFGASGENTSNQENTLTALTDKNGNAIIDPIFNKPSYSNSAVSLSVPETINIYPVQYTTTLTWSLEAAPTE